MIHPVLHYDLALTGKFVTITSSIRIDCRAREQAGDQAGFLFFIDRAETDSNYVSAQPGRAGLLALACTGIILARISDFLLTTYRSSFTFVIV